MLLRYLLCFFFSLSIIGQAQASLEQQRNQFRQSLKALPKLQPTEFKQHLKQLDGYPLQSYLNYRYLKQHIANIDEKTLNQFIDQHQDNFYGNRLRNHWLVYLAKTRQWHRYLKHYQLPQPVSRQCQRLTALIETGNTKQALTDTPPLWLYGRSQHKNCDPAFALLAKQAKLTPALRWQRIELALHNQQFSLADYLAKSAQKSDLAKQWIQQWRLAHSKPQTQLTRLIPLVLPQPINAKQAYFDIIHHGLNRLARKSTAQAFKLWQQLDQKYSFTEQQQHKIRDTIATRAALNRQDKTLTYYGDVPEQPWRARAALWQQDWQDVQKAITSLTTEQKQENRWQYWLARSYAAQGKQHKANVIFHKLMLDRDYYSFLAADKLGKPYQMNHQSLAFDDKQFKAFSQNAAIAQLHEFYILGLNLEARQQAYHLKQRLDKTELEMLAKLTHQWGWHNQTIALLGKAKSWNDLSLRFPVVYEEHFVKASKSTKFDPSLLLGIARQESAFAPKARSAVGARGLMQLMPKTARAIAKTIKAPVKKLSELHIPSRNIQLGSAYLRQVYYQHQNNTILATASYNAGPHRVDRWLPKNTLPADIWIENIPFNETRKYTANVIAYAAIFDHQRQQKITRLSQRMPAVKPKKD